MKLGIDFGTTRIVVATADRGNFPVVSFDTPEGISRDWFPPLVAIRGDERLYGWDAWAMQTEPGWTLLRSLKRLLPEAGPETRLEVGGQVLPLQDLFVGLVSALCGALREHSTLPAGDTEYEVMLGVPANANSNQRFLTVEAFRRGGFQVLGLLNEPSAAAIEFGHRNRDRKGSRHRLLVYDLGGGTFDVSLVESEDRTHTVVAYEGVSTLGGDDFDEVLAELVLQQAGLTAEREQMTEAELFRFHEECRQKKEALNPNSRKVAVDLDMVRGGWPTVAVPVTDFYEHCRPLVNRTMEATEALLRSVGLGDRTVETLYVTGGGSELPLVPRALRERFGRHVQRSQYTRLATAIGLAIQADAEDGYVLRERFTRHFGVWREGDAGRSIVFDPLFAKGTALPAAGEPPLVIRRSYAAVHNIGHFRYLECSHRSDDGRPAGDITVWDDILFPFDPALREQEDLTPVPVFHSNGHWAEETYTCDASGTVTVAIANTSGGYSRAYRLGRWTAAAKTMTVPATRKRRAKRQSD